VTFELSLAELREHVEFLASEDGDFFVVCGRSGERPVPAAGQRFDSRAVARRAAQVTEQYRASLRRYDPTLPKCDPIVCQSVPPLGTTGDCPEGPTDDAGLPVESGSNDDGHRLVEFCHEIATAVFEALSEEGFDDVESTVVEAYHDLAGAIADPDELCLSLVEVMAVELDDRLGPEEQARVLYRAAEELGGDPSRSPLARAIHRLQRVGLVEQCGGTPLPGDSGEAESVVLELSTYALSPRDGRLPVLPVVVELCRRRQDRRPSSVAVTRIESGWRIALGFAAGAAGDGLVNPRIREDLA
jgi:hypothetical protein